jgi:hypothetical protein
MTKGLHTRVSVKDRSIQYIIRNRINLTMAYPPEFPDDLFEAVIYLFWKNTEGKTLRFAAQKTSKNLLTAMQRSIYRKSSCS